MLWTSPIRGGPWTQSHHCRPSPRLVREALPFVEMMYKDKEGQLQDVASTYPGFA